MEKEESGWVFCLGAGRHSCSWVVGQVGVLDATLVGS